MFSHDLHTFRRPRFVSEFGLDRVSLRVTVGPKNAFSLVSAVKG